MKKYISFKFSNVPDSDFTILFHGFHPPAQGLINTVIIISIGDNFKSFNNFIFPCCDLFKDRVEEPNTKTSPEEEVFLESTNGHFLISYI